MIILYQTKCMGQTWREQTGIPLKFFTTTWRIQHTCMFVRHCRTEAICCNYYFWHLSVILTFKYWPLINFIYYLCPLSVILTSFLKLKTIHKCSLPPMSKCFCILSESQVLQVVSLLHGDLHDDHSLSLVHHTCTTIQKMVPVTTPLTMYCCNTLHKKVSGKVIRIVSFCFFWDVNFYDQF